MYNVKGNFDFGYAEGKSLVKKVGENLSKAESELLGDEILASFLESGVVCKDASAEVEEDSEPKAKAKGKGK